MPTLGWGMPAGVSRGGPQFAAGRLGQPEAVCAEEGVEQAGKPAHDSDESNFVRFAVGGEALVAGLRERLVANRRHGGHVEQVAGLGAAATDGAAAAVLAGVAVEGGDAEEPGRAALRRPRRPSSGMAAQREAALTGPKPGIDWMMASRRESSASAAMQWRMRRSQAAMSAWRPRGWCRGS